MYTVVVSSFDKSGNLKRAGYVNRDGKLINLKFAYKSRESANKALEVYRQDFPYRGIKVSVEKVY